MPKKNPKDATLNIKLPQELKDRIFYAATRKALDMSTFARMLIAQGLDSCDEKRWMGKKKPKNIKHD